MSLSIPPVSPSAVARGWLCAAHYWTYRLGALVVLNVLDDPAWLALIFC